MGAYRKSTLIKANRKHQKLTRAALAEDICDELTLLRYETGEIVPTNEKYYQLMSKLGQDGNVIIIPYTDTSLSYIKLQEDINTALQRENYDLCNCYLDKLSKHPLFDTSIAENQQFILRVYYCIQFLTYKITATELISKLKDALSLTFKGFSATSLPPCRIYSSIELLIIHNIAATYKSIGKIKTSLTIYHNIVEAFHNSTGSSLAKPFYNILVSYSNLLGLNGYYKECRSICSWAIEWLLSQDNQLLPSIFYYNIGWTLEEEQKQLYFEDSQTPITHPGKPYIWMAYVFTKFYNEPESLQTTILNYYHSINN